MANFLAHISFVILLYLITRRRFDLPSLLIGSLIPDIEYLYKFLGMVFIHRYSFYELIKPKLMHSIVGCFLVLLPISLVIRYLLNKKTFRERSIKVVLISLIIGITSHLILDLPAHRNLPIFYPFKMYEKNPFLFTSPLNYAILSTIIPLILILYLITKSNKKFNLSKE